MKMKFLSSFIVLVVVSLGFAVGTTLRPKPVKPTAIAGPGKPDRKTTKINVTAPSSGSGSNQATTISLSGPVSCSVNNPVFSSMCANVTPKGGIVRSPDFPKDYGNDRNITVTIEVSAGNKIQLNFNVFNLEADQTNKYDFIYVYDGNTSVYLLNGMSGSKAPPMVTTKTNKMIIQFTSDASNKRVAAAPYNWQATFTVLEVTTTAPTTSTETTTQMKTSTVITTSSTPSTTKTSTPSTTTSTTTPSTTTTTSTPSTTTSTTTPSTTTTTSTPSTTTTTSTPSTTTSTTTSTPSTTTQLKTTTVTTASTWSTTPQTTSSTTPSPITCTVTTPGCGVMCVNLTSTGGDVQSPDFPLDYGDNRNCIITIVMPAKKKIQLKFTAFNLEADVGGTKGFDYIDVLDVKAASILLNGVSGSTIPPVVTTKNNKMMISFTSDRNNQVPSNATYNWKATFSMVN